MKDKKGKSIVAIVNSTQEKVGVEVSGPTLTTGTVAAMITIAAGAVLTVIGLVGENPALIGVGVGSVVAGIAFLISSGVTVRKILGKGEISEELYDFRDRTVKFHKVDERDNFVDPPIAVIDFKLSPLTISYYLLHTDPLTEAVVMGRSSLTSLTLTLTFKDTPERLDEIRYHVTISSARP